MDATAFVVADSGDCLGIQRDEVARVKGRRLLSLTGRDLEQLAPTGSWIMAVLLCPGDGTEDLARWARRRPAQDLDRIGFYEHPDVDARRSYLAWVKAELPMPLRDKVNDFAGFHRLFGNDLNDRIYADAKAGILR